MNRFIFVVFCLFAFSAATPSSGADESHNGNAFVEGKGTGKGAYSWPDGMRYEGDFVDGKMMGKGVLTTSDGNRYEGDFANDKMHGNGVMLKKNGDRYEGGFANSKLHGKGTLTFIIGERYAGDFVGGKFTGKGIFTYSNGDKYDGDFLDNKKTGKGVYTWSNGNKYEGDFVDGESKGAGVYTLADGSRLQGEFADWRTGRLHGFGSKISAKGVVIQKGWFETDFVIACVSPADCKQRIEKRQAEERKQAALEQARLEKRQVEDGRKAAIAREREEAQACNRYYSGYVGNIDFQEKEQGFWGTRNAYYYGGFIVIASRNGNVNIQGVDNGRWRGGGNYPSLGTYKTISCTRLRDIEN